MATGIAISARGLDKCFDDGLVQALRGMDLEVQGGERVAVMGPTGCGKSTLLSLLALLDAPDGGELLLEGGAAAAIRSPERWRAANVGIVFQLHHLLPHLTVRENVALPLLDGRRRDGVADRVAAVLDDLGLSHRGDARAATLSGGERQLAAVARALVGEPRLILADEPTGNVDTATGRRIVETLAAWSGRRAATVVVVTHDREVAAVADRIVHMRDGRVDNAPGR